VNNETNAHRREDARVTVTRQSLADLDTAKKPLGLQVDVHYWLGRIQRCAEMLLEYIDETGGRPTVAPAVHTGALDHQLAEALHTADRVHFTVDRDTDAAHRHGVDAWAGTSHVITTGTTPGEALASAMQMLTAAAAVTQ
jgi:hypothetical protein